MGERWSDRGRWSCEQRFEDWSRRIDVDEAYRVIRVPSSHGGFAGWQVTIWRRGEAWSIDEQPLDYEAAVPTKSVAVGQPLHPMRAEVIAKAFEATTFFSEAEWPERGGLDGFEAVFEGFRRAEGYRMRSAWTPTYGAHHACTIFAIIESTLAKPKPQRVIWPGCLALTLVLAGLGGVAWWIFAP